MEWNRIKTGLSSIAVLCVFEILSACNMSTLETMVGSGTPKIKTINSSWTNDDGSKLELASLKVPSTQIISFEIESIGTCSCNVASSASGSQTKLSVSSCTLTVLPTYTAQNVSVNCATFASQYILSQSGSNLSSCDSAGSCDAYY